MRTEIEALKEIRDRISYFCSRTDGKYDPPWAQEVIGIIDDVLTTPLNQETHKRELSKNVSKNGADFGQLGDAAKLREALIDVVKRLEAYTGCDHHTFHPTATTCDGITSVGKCGKIGTCAAIFKARAALAAPPRNCDLPEVAKDPWRAWLDDRSNWDEFGSPNLEAYDWLLAPATEKEGGNDGNE